nr:RNA-directed DNA polymerase, eukaryota [Tanacetum cinerariifolium]
MYDPQSIALKRFIWEYISLLISHWDGETIVMGDFNEVRSSDERFGSVFNLSSARAFNSFISVSRLVDVKMKAYSFAWSHPSASKMSKLDGFLVSEVEGDENSKFFHGIIIKKRSQLSSCGVIVDGQWKTDSDVVKDAFKDHFANRFKHPQQSRFKLNFAFLNRLSNDQVVNLDRCISHDEIRAAVWNCGVNKSSDHDGYSFEFFRRYWRFIGPDFCSTVAQFFDTGQFPSGCNASFIALIPKVADAKVMAHSFLMRFLLGVNKKKKHAMVFKVGFAKAYDSVGWDYLLDVLLTFGFGPNWCKWIRGTFSSFMASILVNGSPSSEFPFFCGLKQGNPLAPFLFILVMESLHISFSRATSEGVFNWIQIHESLKVSHLFYADDDIFIGEWSQSNMVNIVKILNCFYLAFGLKINIQKSQLLGVGVHRDLVYQPAGFIGCSVMQTSFRYLGRLTILKSVLWASPLYHMSLYKIPKGILHEMEMIRSNFFKGAAHSERKISWVSWSKVLASKKYGDSISVSRCDGWRLYNIIQGYLVEGILHEMEMIRSNFFKGAAHSERKISWVSWGKVLASKKYGGLSVSSYYALNCALLLKWVWRFISQDGSL